MRLRQSYGSLKRGQLLWHTGKVGPGTWILHVGPFSWDPGPYMRDPIWNQDQISLRGTQGPYINTNLGTLTLIQLSLNVRFSSAA